MTSPRALGGQQVIDVIQALELLEICADEMAGELDNGEPDHAGGPRRRMGLTARALAKRQLTLAQLANWPLSDCPNRTSIPRQPAMTVGALIVFRTAHRFGRAGASIERTLDAVYCAAHRYTAMVPRSLQDDVDKVAMGELMARTESFATAT
jgi:hypothetical protein